MGSPPGIDGEWHVDDDGVVQRRSRRSLDADTFERIAARIRDGLEWGVAGLAVRDGAVLLVRQDGRWVLPGGGVESGEAKTAALVREMREETGLDATVGPLRVVTEQTFTHGDEEVMFHFAIYDVAVEGELTGDPGLEDESVTDVSWFETLPDDTLDRPLVRFLRDD
ncbi:NUDIX domain-containing protein [Haloferax sp. MBLA0076]|uniref:NUDIX domain-containing protein n=1 Tax=Haloferax litoreum TaxID=2666140 RepID=A0A6A8GH83_9EURY|nr:MULTISPECIES: NUDIX domain-containing protein [Haloferax]KAB1193988.1 NUDIX domain-containing protein [Haloferax sp. CBA1148]MRX22535.1 NUDIX domain-containing protein [Haloferax litoreum]